MAVDLQDEGRSVGMLRGIFDHERGVSEPDLADLLARAEIALAELVRGLRRAEDRAVAQAGRAEWNAAFVRGYDEGRVFTARSIPTKGPIKASEVAPARDGSVCDWCRAAVAAEVSGYEMDEAVTADLTDQVLLQNLARELGADLPGHRCAATAGFGTCACGCALWRGDRAWP